MPIVFGENVNILGQNQRGWVRMRMWCHFNKQEERSRVGYSTHLFWQCSFPKKMDFILEKGKTSIRERTPESKIGEEGYLSGSFG